MKRVVALVLALILCVAPWVQAASVILGDVSGDGEVNVRDYGLLQQYLNDWDVTIPMDAADVTGDDEVNVRDYALLQQYLNDWDVQFTPNAETKRAFYQSLVDSENAWIARTQLSNGALAMTPTNYGKVQVNPYFADFAALSLLNQPELYADVVKEYMQWHFDHLNTAVEDPSGLDGTIFDYTYTVKNGVVTLEEWTTPPPPYDSTDAYARALLMVVEKYARQTGDTAYVLSHAQDIHRVLNSLFATMDNGLTYGQPTSKVKMLMDNCEVYGGLRAAASLYRDVLRDEEKSARMDDAAAELVVAMEKDLWIGKYYAPAIYLDGSLYTPFSWDKYYPSAAAQTFPIFHGVLDPDSDRAKMLYNEYCTRYDWEHHRHPDKYMWSSNAYTAAVMGDDERVYTFLSVYHERVSASRGFPLYNADAAWACMTAYYMTQL